MDHRHQQPNILMLTVDALRADRTSLHGYDRPTTPTLERLAKTAVVCENAFSMATFTQAASAQMFTSSRPLSYGGYDYGAEGRPETVFKRFHDAGYKTTCLTTLHWVNRFFGYDEGIDEEIQTFGLNSLPGVALAMIRNTLLEFEKGNINDGELLGKVDPVLLRFFDNTSVYCDLILERGDEIDRDFPDSALVNSRYDFAKIKAAIGRHRQEYQAGKIAYIRRHLIPTPVGKEWMNRWLVREWRYCRKPSRLIAELFFRAGNLLLGWVNAKWARARQNRFKIYPDAHSLADKVIGLLEQRDKTKPFFIWTHFMDTHHPYVSGPGRKWYRHTPRLLEALGYSPDIDPSLSFDGKPKRKQDGDAFSALYDCAVRSTDDEIGRIVDAVERLGLRDDTLIIVAGDHGEELGDHGDFGHYFLHYTHNTRVPMVFSHPKIGKTRLDGLFTIADMPPTVAALAGVDPAPDWEGLAVTEPGGGDRDHVLLETFYGGNCLFDHRPLYFAVRTKDHLYCWREYKDPADKFSPDGPELFNIRDDPSETHNLYRPDHQLISRFNALIAERMAEIPEITDQRIIDCFGDIGRDAVAAGCKRDQAIGK